MGSAQRAEQAIAGCCIYASEGKATGARFRAQENGNLVLKGGLHIEG